jgi:hypothetical protein
MLPQPTLSPGRPLRFAVVKTAALLACAALAGLALADGPLISEDRLFQPVDLNGHDGMGEPAYGEPLAGQPFQDFTIQPPPRTFPNCRLPLLSWRVGPGLDCAQYGANVALDIPAHAIRKAEWYGSADLVALRRDPREKLTFAQVDVVGVGVPALSTANIDYPLDAGLQFSIGRKLTERLSFEAMYMGQNEWQSQTAVRNALDNTVFGGTTTGALASPFTQFGLLGQQAGLDFNNFVSVNTTDRLEMLDLLFRYRPDMPYGAYDVSFLYGLRYMQASDTLLYHSESFEPGPGGSVNDLNVATDNDLIGIQLGLTSHILVLPAYWIDWDVKGTLFNNHARQQTIYQNTDANGAFTSFTNTGAKDDTAGSLDVRVIGNFQLLPRLTLRAGYQAMFTTGMATAVGNFQTDLDIVRFGPSTINTRDDVIYHGPVAGIMWER